MCKLHLSGDYFRTPTSQRVVPTCFKARTSLMLLDHPGAKRTIRADTEQRNNSNIQHAANVFSKARVKSKALQRQKPNCQSGFLSTLFQDRWITRIQVKICWGGNEEMCFWTWMSFDPKFARKKDCLITSWQCFCHPEFCSWGPSHSSQSLVQRMSPESECVFSQAIKLDPSKFPPNLRSCYKVSSCMISTKK